MAFGREVRRGVVTHNGEQEVVSGIVLKLYGENTSEVIERLYRKVAAVQKMLPAGVRLVPYYEQAELVAKATGTVKNALLVGGALVILVLLVFLESIRAALLVALTLPVCALIAFIGMRWFGVSANLMSLGGIAVAIGMLCDGAIVMIESILLRLGPAPKPAPPRRESVFTAGTEVSRPIVFAGLIVIIVFLPLFTLEGVEGRMFAPMAFTIAAAMLGSILTALFLMPVLAHAWLPKMDYHDSRIVARMKRWYRPLLLVALRHRKAVPVIALLVFLGALSLLANLGTEFVPVLEEGSIFIGVTMAPSISLAKATETIMGMEKIIHGFAPVKETVCRIGRPEAGSHPHPVNYGEIQIALKPPEHWGAFRRKSDLVAAMNERLRHLPGVQLNFTQPIQNAFDELVSGVKTQLAIKVFGEDLAVLQKKAGEIHRAIQGVPGLVDLSVEQSLGQPQVQIIADRAACARYGVDVDDVLQMIEVAVGGAVIDQLYLQNRRFGIFLRYQEAFREDPAQLRDLHLATHRNGWIPLGQVARVKTMTGPSQINREQNQRRWTVQGNIRGRDLGGVVEQIRHLIAAKVKLPPGYTVEFGGQFENQRRAMGRLTLIVPVVILAVFMVLWTSFGAVRPAVVIFTMVPLSCIGGVFGLAVMGEYLSVPASVGFIALFGMAMLDGLVMVTSFHDLRAQGKTLRETVLAGSLLRLGPVLMTTVTTLLGLLPLLLASGIGSEVQRPLASVVVFGLSTSTLLTLFVIPTVYYLVERRAIGSPHRVDD